MENLDGTNIDFKSKALKWRFWELLSRFFTVPNKFEGTVRDFAIKLNFSVADGFFYKVVLPVLTKNNILVDTGKKYKFAYVGNFGKVYRFNRDNLSIFFIKNNEIARRIFEVWVKENDVDPSWDEF
jgi:hypothetical protein